MTIRTLDIIAIAGLFGYTAQQAKSIRDISIGGDRHEVTVTRFVQDPGSQEPRKVVPPSDTWGNALVVNEVFRYRADQSDFHGVQPEYFMLSKPAVNALKQTQWEQ